MLSRLPTQVRLSLAFVAVVAVVLVGVGVAQRLVLVEALDAHVNGRLRDDFYAVSAAVGGRAGRLAPQRAPLLRAGIGFAQVIDEHGRVIAQTPLRRGGAILGTGELRRARHGPVVLGRATLPGVDPPARVLARPIERGGRRLVVVVGGSTDARDAAVHQLERILLIGGPLTLLLVSIAGYGLATAALRPVASMRRNALAMAEEEAIRGLALPAARDEIRRLGEALNQMLARIARSVRRERAFVAEASHELRTPLAVLTAELEVATHPDRTRGELRECVESARNEVRRLTRISDDLLMLSQADIEELPLRREALNARQALLDTLASFRARLREEGRSGQVEAPGELWLDADSDRLRQALVNLVCNALRHGSGAITLRAASLKGHVELSVRDRGPGLPPAFLDRAFERFARAERGRCGGGAGLGLPIVAAIARAHGGSAGIRNHPEGGAQAWLALPACAPPPADGQPPPRFVAGTRVGLDRARPSGPV